MNRSVILGLLLLAACAESAVREPSVATTAAALSRPDAVYMICAHDRDGDHVPDVYDRCDLVKGDRALGGCHDDLGDVVTDLHGFEFGARHVERYAVHFGQGTSALAPADAAELERLTTAWRETSTLHVEVYGILGPRDVQSLAEARMRTVHDALAQRGVTPAQVRVSSPWCDADASDGFVQVSADLTPTRAR